jgi:hypothetical protein
MKRAAALLASLWAASALAGTVTVGSNASLDLSTGSLALGCADLDVAGTLAGGSVGFSGGRDVTITSSGVVQGDTATLELSGDWDNQGTFVPGTSTVRIVDGCSLLSGMILGKTSFYELEIESASGRQVTFEAGTTQQVTGAFSVAGVDGNLLKIRSSVGGEAAWLNVSGASSATFVDVEDNDATPGGPIALGSDSVKGPNTPGWQASAVIPLLPPAALAALALGLAGWARRALRRAD